VQKRVETVDEALERAAAKDHIVILVGIDRCVACPPPLHDEPTLVETTVRLPEPLERAVKHHCIYGGLSFQDVVIRALELYLRSKGGKH
jgi:hypothetical protein